jgi:hypothetical protein
MAVGAIRLKYIPTQWKVGIVSVMGIASFRDSIEKKNCKSERTIEGAANNQCVHLSVEMYC